MSKSFFLTLCLMTSFCFSAPEGHVSFAEPLRISLHHIKEKIDNSGLLRSQKAALLISLTCVHAQLEKKEQDEITLSLFNHFVESINNDNQDEIKNALGQWLTAYEESALSNVSSKKVLAPLATVVEDLLQGKHHFSAFQKKEWKKWLWSTVVLIGGAGIVGWYFFPQKKGVEGVPTTEEDSEEIVRKESSEELHQVNMSAATPLSKEEGEGRQSPDLAFQVNEDILNPIPSSSVNEEMVHVPLAAPDVQTVLQTSQNREERITPSPLSVTPPTSSTNALSTRSMSQACMDKSKNAVFSHVKYQDILSRWRERKWWLGNMGVPIPWLKLGESFEAFFRSGLKDVRNACSLDEGMCASFEEKTDHLYDCAHSLFQENFSSGIRKIESNRYKTHAVLLKEIVSENIKEMVPFSHYRGNKNQLMSSATFLRRLCSPYLSLSDIIDQAPLLLANRQELGYTLFSLNSLENLQEDLRKALILALWCEENTESTVSYKKRLWQWLEKEHSKKRLKQWREQYSFIRKMNSSGEASMWEETCRFITSHVQRAKEDFKKYFFLFVRDSSSFLTEFNQQRYQYCLYSTLQCHYSTFLSTSGKEWFLKWHSPHSEEGILIPFRAHLMDYPSQGKYVYRAARRLYRQENVEAFERKLEEGSFSHPYFFSDDYDSYTFPEIIKHYQSCITEYFFDWFFALEKEVHFCDVCEELNFTQMEEKAGDWYSLLKEVEYKIEGEEIKPRSYDDSVSIIEERQSLCDEETQNLLHSWRMLHNPDPKISKNAFSDSVKPVYKEKLRTYSRGFHTILSNSNSRFLLNETEAEYVGRIKNTFHYRNICNGTLGQFYKTLSDEVVKLFDTILSTDSIQEVDPRFVPYRRLFQEDVSKRKKIEDIRTCYLEEVSSIKDILNSFERGTDWFLSGNNTFEDIKNALKGLSGKAAVLRGAINAAKRWHARTQEALDALFALLQEETSTHHSASAAFASEELSVSCCEQEKQRESDRAWRESFMQACQTLLEVPTGLEACCRMVSEEKKACEGTEEEKGIKACANIFDPKQKHAHNQAFWKDMERLYFFLFSQEEAGKEESKEDMSAEECAHEGGSIEDQSAHMRTLIKKFTNVCEYLACQKALQREPMPADEQGAYPFSFSCLEQNAHSAGKASDMQAGGGY